MNEQKNKIQEIIKEAKRIREQLKQHNKRSESIRPGNELGRQQNRGQSNLKPSRGRGSRQLSRPSRNSRTTVSRPKGSGVRTRERDKPSIKRIRGVNDRNLNIKQTNNKIMNKLKSGSPVNNNYTFNTPMPRMETEVTALSGIDKIRMRGTEYLTSISVSTTALEPVGTTPGDVLYTLPLNPHFLSGTRLIELTRLYTKYKWRHFTIEYIPVVPSTQNGSVILYFSYDPEENNFLLLDQDDRLRRSLAHTGAIDFNVFSYARCTLVDDKMIDNYFVNLEGDVRLENQGTLYVVAGSSYSPSMLAPTEEVLELGQILIHYELELEERSLVQDLSNVISSSAALSTTLAAMFVNYDVAEAPLYILDTFWTSLIGQLEPWQLIIVIPTITLVSAASAFSVENDNTPDGGVSLFIKGSVWYLRSSSEDFTQLRIFDSLEGAMTETSFFHTTPGSVHAGTDAVQVAFRYWIHDTRNL
jgi:hypothetical protein